MGKGRGREGKGRGREGKESWRREGSARNNVHKSQNEHRSIGLILNSVR